ncbi:MAG: hypothetical protein U0840_27555 [Gemmataceae bacterium]
MRNEAKRRLKKFLAGYCQPLLSVMQRYRRGVNQRREHRIAEQVASFRQSFSERCEWTVQHGPLQGLRYRPGSRSDSLMPRLVGCYEAELHASIEQALAREPAVLVDIGCEEGYFAVGLALRRPEAIMYAFDINPAAQGWCREMAQLNGVAERVRIDAACTAEKLQGILEAGGLVFCDCEGGEHELLDPVQVPALYSADMIVELHDHERTDVDITPTLRARFADTHDIRIFGRARREAEAYPCLEWLPSEQRRLAMHEPRMAHQQWAYLQCRKR